MEFTAAKIVGAILDPGNLILIIAVSGILIILLPFKAGSSRAVVGRSIVGLGVVLALMFAVLPLGQMAEATLENRFPAPEPMPLHVDGVVLLGGVVAPVLSAQRGGPALNGSAGRLFGFAALYRRYPRAQYVFSGGTGSLSRPDLPESDAVRPLLDALGMDTDRIIFEAKSRDTCENAREALALVGDVKDKRWLLVTSAHHMPRAVACFRAVGWPVIAYPTDYRTAPDQDLALSFSLRRGLDHAATATHEWAGLLGYWIIGRTDELFPAP